MTTPGATSTSLTPTAGGMRTAYPRHSCLHHLFDAQAHTRPHAPAAIHDDRAISYGELRSRATSLAARLHAAGVGHGDRVGVCGSRCLEALVAIVAILKTGAAYVPLDDTLPPARLQAMTEDAGVQVAVRLPGSTAQPRRLRTCIDLAGPPSPDLGAPPAVETTALDRAYVMFTSGTSGRPKPVAIPHRGVVRLALSDPTLAPPGPADRVLHAYDLSSDASTIEIWSTLLGGACLVLIDREELLSAAALEQRLHTHAVTMAYLTTSVFHAVARTRPTALSGLRWVSAGGEVMDPDLARAIVTACPDTTVANLYGPTENTVVSLAHIVDDVPTGTTSVPIGRPIANSTCFVVRDDGTLADLGEEGELLVGGDGLALGYLDDPELTARRFGAAPHDPNIQIYRTGDRARQLPDGTLEYRGRHDRQIKLRGQRIELDEIETQLRNHPDVGEAVVEPRGDSDRPSRLIAYLTAAAPDRPVPVEGLRQELAAWLPAQAIPARLVEMARFPVNSAGKVDRAKLATLATPAARAAEAPDSPTGAPAPAERPHHPHGLLAGVWETVLRVRPGPSQDFFALGGDSLLAAEVVTRTLTALGLDLAHGSDLIRCLLDNPTLAGYAAAVARLRGTGGATDTPPPDWEAEAQLGFTLPRPHGDEPRWQHPRDVVLTGASGFFGAFLLDRLLRATNARIHCPVRARDATHARKRIRGCFERYGLDPTLVADRVNCFPYDLTAPGLGLDHRHRDDLAATLDLIVHAASQVNFLYPYSALRAANVDSLRTLVEMAAPRRVPLHFVSTIAVVAGFGTAGTRHVTEETPLAHADRLTMGYAESKWVAERVLQDAAEQGLPLAIHRPYEITGDQHNGACNTETAICSLFRTVAETGLAPDIALPMDFVPVDYAADALVHIATHQRPTRRVYHLTNPAPARFADMLERMRAAGYPITLLGYQEWVAELVRHVAAHPTCPTAPFVSLCVDRSNKADISVKEMYFAETFPSLGRDNIESALAGSGLHCPPVDHALLDRYLDYFRHVGYLPHPEAA
ncbi:amino acid adenylation domain-containing protein [Salinactinospora qingdaonensis]|uniref:Polyketide synthase-like phosphopantetheine-binding domain-containing protein n=1 Tax=Salinactinospora qingdaonensis TaxID=702744 RepID=A0ABP7FIF4_9ACTN